MVIIKPVQFISSLKDVHTVQKKVHVLDHDIKNQLMSKLHKLRLKVTELRNLEASGVKDSVFSDTVYSCSKDFSAHETRRFIAGLHENPPVFIFMKQIPRGAILLNNVLVVTNYDLSINKVNLEQLLAEEGIKLTLDQFEYIRTLVTRSKYPPENELEKIINFIKGGGKLSDAENLVAVKENVNVFDIVNNLLDSHKEEAVYKLYMMLKKGYDEKMIIGSLTWFFRKIISLKYLLQQNKNIDVKAASSELGIKFNAYKYVKFAELRKLDQLSGSIKLLEEADMLLKTSSINIYPLLCRALIFA